MFVVFQNGLFDIIKEIRDFIIYGTDGFFHILDIRKKFFVDKVYKN